MAEYIQEALQQGFIQPSKLALEEWHHWLEREEFPFTVITDQKNLLYLRNAKRLNPRQACWALFFTRFNFTISYRRRDHNVKANSLLRIHSPDVPTEPESILPPAIVVSPIQWDLRECICTTTRREPAPLGGPEGKTYVPASQRQTLMGSVHPGSYPSTLSRSSKLSSGDPVLRGTSCSTSAAAQSVPYPKLHAISLQVSWSICPFPAGPGRILGWISSPIFPT